MRRCGIYSDLMAHDTVAEVFQVHHPSVSRGSVLFDSVEIGTQ